MVVVGVADQDQFQLAVDGVQDVLHMLRAVRTGVEHGEAAGRLDQVGVGAVIGHRAGIGGDDAGDAGQDGMHGAADGLGFGQEGHCGSFPLLLILSG